MSIGGCIRRIMSGRSLRGGANPTIGHVSLEDAGPGIGTCLKRGICHKLIIDTLTNLVTLQPHVWSPVRQLAVRAHFRHPRRTFGIRERRGHAKLQMVGWKLSCHDGDAQSQQRCHHLLQWTLSKSVHTCVTKLGFIFGFHHDHGMSCHYLNLESKT